MKKLNNSLIAMTMFVASISFVGCVDKDYSLSDGVDFDDITIGTETTVINAPLGTITIDINDLILESIAPKTSSKALKTYTFTPLLNEKVLLGDNWLDKDVVDKLSASGSIVLKAEVVNPPAGFPEFKLNVSFGDLLVFKDQAISTAQPKIESLKLEAAQLRTIAESSTMIYSLTSSATTFECDLDQVESLIIKLSIEKTGSIKL